MAEVDPIDFDPTTEEGREDINEEIDKDTDFLLPRENETGESFKQRINNKFNNGADYAISRLASLFKTRNPGKAVPEYMELQNIDTTLNRQREDILIDKYPDLDENLIMITINEKTGKQQILFFSARKNNWTKPEMLYNEDKTVRNSVEKKIKSGKYNRFRIEEIDSRNSNLQEEEDRNNEQINRNNEERIGATTERIRAIDRENERLEERNSQINEEITENNIEAENLEERMTLSDRIKYIFKKYGFTVVSVAIAVSTVIGVVISQLKNGLSSVAKGVGNGLKTLGKKLGDILPGMIGAIASFIFKTAGEVISFLAEHAWLLIVAVVVFVVEKFKK